MSITSKYTDNCFCDDLNCECEDGGIPTHEQHAVVPLTMLHYLAQRAHVNLVFLPDGRVWIGEDFELEALGEQLDAEVEAKAKQAQQAQQKYFEERLKKEAEANGTTEAVAEMGRLLAAIQKPN